MISADSVEILASSHWKNKNVLCDIRDFYGRNISSGMLAWSSAVWQTDIEISVEPTTCIFRLGYYSNQIRLFSILKMEETSPSETKVEFYKNARA